MVLKQMVDVCLLGCAGMIPLPERYLTALLLRHNGRVILTDCGEGTQVAIRRSGFSVKHIDLICFTHFHADHVAGLPGLLLSIGNNGRTEPITLTGPQGLREVVEGLSIVCPVLPFEIALMELPCAPFQFQAGEMLVRTLPVDHSMPCVAYSFYLPRLGKFDADKAASLSIPKPLWRKLQQGETVYYDDNTATPEQVMGEMRHGIKVTYCTDTRPIASLTSFVGESELFICEGMYGDTEKLPDAIEKKHMLFWEAAQLARDGAVHELWLTHFSPSLTDPHAYLSHTQEIFANTILGENLLMKTLFYEKS